MNVPEAICTINFWLLFMAMICGMGSGLATINNIRQSLRYSTVQLNSLVIPVFSCSVGSYIFSVKVIGYFYDKVAF
ncbi:unnamed protein product, partial [Brassica oleracea var. botrytis]